MGEVSEKSAVNLEAIMDFSRKKFEGFQKQNNGSEKEKFGLGIYDYKINWLALSWPTFFRGLGFCKWIIPAC